MSTRQLRLLLRGGFDRECAGAGALARIPGTVESGLASGEVRGTPTLFIDGVVHRGQYDAESLARELALR